MTTPETPTSTDTAHYDLIIIGTGSANSILDERFAAWRVAIVERGAFGGTCTNRGCIPSKMYIYPADVIMEMRHLADLGVDVELLGVRWKDIRDRIFGRIDNIEASGRRYRKGQDNVDVYEGDARFCGTKRLRIAMADGSVSEISGDRVVIAAGARPTVPDIDGLEEVGFHTSDTVMRIDAVPPRLAVLGGGFIACEQAHLFEAFGSTVTMLVRGEALLTAEDTDVSQRFTELTSQRLDLRLRTRVTSVRRTPEGIELTTRDADGAIDTVVVDEILVATGRTPNGRELDVAATGVQLDDSGLVQTDDALVTCVDGVYALGDVRAPMQLKHVANHEARVVQHNLLHPDEPTHIDERLVPHAVFGFPQIASVGETEQALRLSGRDYLVGRRDHGGTAYGWAMEDTTGFVKVLVDPTTREVLGAHIIGHQAAILLQQLVQGMRAGETADVMARHQMYPHPALSEVVENALLDV